MTEPSFSVCEFSTPQLTFEEDLRAYRAGGAEGIGIAESKLRSQPDREFYKMHKESGLGATFCIPEVFSVLPLPKMPGPEHPGARVAHICDGIRRLAPFEPRAIICVTGPTGGFSPEEAKVQVIDGLREISRTAREEGVIVALEPIDASFPEYWTFLKSVRDAVDLLDDAGLEQEMKILFDCYNLCHVPDVVEEARAYATRVIGVHVADWRDPTRGWCDRVFPGDGVIDLRAMLRALREGGYTGWYELEVCSDNGTFEDNYPDSLWNLEGIEFVERARASFERTWEASLV